MKYDKNFETVMDYVFKSEGGFRDSKNDLGGRTDKGVTQTTYNAWRKKKGLAPKDVKGISTEEAKQLYYEEFWVPTGASKVQDLREGYLLFDMALNSGPYEAKKLYEKSNGNIYQFLKDRKTYYNNLIKIKPKQEEHREGWYNRLKDLENNMNEIINKSYYTPPYQNEQTPYDKGFNNPNLNTDFKNYEQDELQNIRNKYLYLKNKNGVPTGQAANIEITRLAQQLGLQSFNIEIPQQVQIQQNQSGLFGYTNPLTGSNHVYTREEVGQMNSSEFAKHEKEIDAQTRAFNGTMPTNGDLQREAMTGGGVVYVNSYTRSDGTQVRGYYRSRPRF